MKDNEMFAPMETILVRWFDPERNACIGHNYVPAKAAAEVIPTTWATRTTVGTS
jgi:hypothetical protein